MARNIEIKAKASDFSRQLSLGLALSDSERDDINQTDTFFKSPKGRLKLREFSNQDAQLIYYLRSDNSGPTLSEYHITATPNATELKHTLSETLGVLAVVQKTRSVLISGRTRMHFDEVKNLGHFIELEVVVADSDSIANAELEAESLMSKLNITPESLIKEAYVDLILQR